VIANLAGDFPLRNPTGGHGKQGNKAIPRILGAEIFQQVTSNTEIHEGHVTCPLLRPNPNKTGM
jgi:hypothetical protein